MKPNIIFASILSLSMLFSAVSFSDNESAKAMMVDITSVSADTHSVSLAENWSVYEEVVELVNKYRAKNGAGPLKLYYKLCQAAETRANEITKSFSHIRPDGSNCFSVLDEYNIYYYSTAENVAAGYSTPGQVVEGWMNSENHRKNMLSSKYTHVGVGIAEYNGTLYWSLLFTNGTYSDEDEKPQISAASVKSGDVNNDHMVDARDASAILREYAASSTKIGGSFTNEQKKAADVTNDSIIDSRDASVILAFYAQASTANGESSIESFIKKF